MISLEFVDNSEWNDAINFVVLCSVAELFNIEITKISPYYVKMFG